MEETKKNRMEAFTDEELNVMCDSLYRNYKSVYNHSLHELYLETRGEINRRDCWLNLDDLYNEEDEEEEEC